jgi:hypothetical protein
MPPAAGEAPLHETLLRAPAVAAERRPSSRWAYPVGGLLLASVFVLYHVTILLVWNTPGKGLAKSFHASFLKQTYGYEYFNGTRNNQSWAMFAPNPNRSNNFVQVYVRDLDGQDWDFEQDIWGDDRYPYIWYDRRGKVNRRIDGKQHFQRIYGAWVCREWERTHAGVPPKSVTFIRRLTRVPSPREVIDAGGWDQWQAPHKQTEQETVTCKTVAHGTLPNQLRERYGLPMIDEDAALIPVRNRTWWDQRETERRREEREAKQAAARERWESRQTGGPAPALEPAREPVDEPAGPSEPADEEAPDQ